ncbi:uncharacterized protein LOC105699171 isoform X2 [Orussus abietinus]|uniref:uncharacterized protein LOC105699171 isoform X2 n=1 Tax=Orussus abietinus TaxID=222816 RepID=UPI000C7160E4|nr:uncharacterized protein LOC105699171 isoform X2 [Orussus abietinus]
MYPSPLDPTSAKDSVEVPNDSLLEMPARPSARRPSPRQPMAYEITPAVNSTSFVAVDAGAIVAELRKINERLERIERLMRQDGRKGQQSTKPDFLPMKTVQEVLAFNNASDERYNEVVRYLEYLGGFTLREALNLCMKELVTDEVTCHFTWWGRDNGTPLHNTRLAKAIYAVSSNSHFDLITRAEFQAQMRETLRVAKQRNRNAARRSDRERPLPITTIKVCPENE